MSVPDGNIINIPEIDFKKVTKGLLPAPVPFTNGLVFQNNKITPPPSPGPHVWIFSPIAVQKKSAASEKWGWEGPTFALQARNRRRLAHSTASAAMPAGRNRNMGQPSMGGKNAGSRESRSESGVQCIHPRNSLNQNR